MATQPPIGQQAGTPTKPTVVPGTGEKKEPKKKKEPSGVARPRFARPDDNLVITVLKPNSKTGNAGKRFDVVKTGMTVKEYRDILTAAPFNRTPGEYYRELRWNTDPHRQLMHIGPSVVPVPAQAAPTAPKVA
jgi:hypothetical protein